MTGEPAGHRMARDELGEIQILAGGQPLALQIGAPKPAKDGWLAVEISLDCTNVPVSPGHVPLAGHEHATLLIPEHFPFARPHVKVAHDRFAGLPYVLGGCEICLYHSDSDWNPADGMFGVIRRLAAWYRRAAAGQLIEAGQPLHPPLAYRLPFGDADSVVIHPDLPDDFEPAAALMVREYPWRVDVVRWLRPSALDLESPAAVDRLKEELANTTRATGKPAFLGAVRILREPLNFEFPDSFRALVTALAAQNVDRGDLLKQLAETWLANMIAAVRTSDLAPLHVIIGAPMRGRAGAERLGLHLEVWQLDAAEAVLPGILTNSPGDHAVWAAWLRAEQVKAHLWLEQAPLSWAYVEENRRQLVTRRDTGKPAQWLLGKSVMVLGCGALGARIAEHCIRAGVSKLVVADSDAVGPGILVRQPYTDVDIGLPKALQLADRLAEIRPVSTTGVQGLPGAQIQPEVGDIRRTVLGDENRRPQADLIVDATASRGVAARIEWLRRSQPGRWPPVLTIGVGHTCERTVGALTLPHASGAGTDIMLSFADETARDEGLRDAREDFFAEPAPANIFQPEIGCSEPTFTGSDPEVAAAAGQVFSWGLRVLSDHAAHRPVAPKSLFLARSPGDRNLPGHVYLDWPNDVLAEDPDSGYQLRIRPQALADIRDEAVTASRLYPQSWETGGILLGYFDDACRLVWLTAAGRPSPDSLHEKHAFQHGTAGVAELVARHYRDSGGRVGFAGMWHTHPGLPPHASETDAEAMATLLVPVTATQVPRRAVQLIVGGEARRWAHWLGGIGQPEISFRLFRRSQLITPGQAGEEQ